MKHLLLYAIALSFICNNGVEAQSWVSLNGPKLITESKEITVNNGGTPTLYVADDAYLMKSTDGGVSWKGTASDFADPLATACKYTDASIVVASKANTFRLSQDGGGTWNTVTSSPNIETDLIPLRLTAATVSSNAHIMFLGREYVSGNYSVWETTNSGDTWGPSTDFDYATDVYDIATFPGSYTTRRDFVYACGVNPSGSQEQDDPNTESNVNGIYWSPNNGHDWYSKKLGGYNTYSVALLDLGESTDFYVFAAVKGGTYPGVYRSTDGGDNFEEDPIFNNAVVNIIRINNSSSPKAIFLGTDDNVWKSTNNGSSWSKVSSFGPENNITSLAVSGTGTVFAGTTGSLYKSTNNGSTWTEVGKMNVTAADGAGATLWAVSKDNSFVGKTTNGGTSWSNGHIESAGAAFGAEAMHRVGSTGDLFVGGALNNKAAIYRSTNAGSSFSQVYHSSSFSNGSRIYTIGSDLVTYNGYVYAGGGIGISKVMHNAFHSTNHGAAWNVSGFSPLGGGTQSVFGHAAITESIRYVIFGNGQVLKTTNTWQDRDTVLAPSGTENSLAVHPGGTHTVYAARSGGLWRITNNDTSQVRNDNVKRVQFHPSFPASGDNLFALAGDSIYHSTNGGSNWSNVTGDLPTPASTLVAPADAGFLYAGTGKGVFALDIQPAKPQGLAVINTGYSNHPKLTWTANTEVDVNPSGHYLIDCRARIGGQWTNWSTVATVSGSTIEWIDYATCNVGSGSQRLEYRLRARDAGMNLSENSDSVGID